MAGGWGGKGQEKGPCGMAIKLLLSAPEASALLGPAGALIKEIGAQTLTRMHISHRDEYYPGTQLQELAIRGDGYETVATACLHAVAKVVEGTGTICGGDHDVEEGCARVRVIVPVASARALIGKGGENIKTLRAQTGLKVHIDEVAIGEGEMAEQVVVLLGGIAGVQAALPHIIEKVSESAQQHWFSGWACTSNAGHGGNVVATAVVTNSKGKGGWKGGGGWDKGGKKGGWDKGGKSGWDDWGAGAPQQQGWEEQGGGEWDQRNLEVIAGALQRMPPGANTLANRQRICFACPSALVSAVIGKGGSGVKEISGATGANVMIREIEGRGDEKSVTISGTIVGVAAAYIHVSGRISAAYNKGVHLQQQQPWMPGGATDVETAAAMAAQYGSAELATADRGDVLLRVQAAAAEIASLGLGEQAAAELQAAAAAQLDQSMYAELLAQSAQGGQGIDAATAAALAGLA